MSASIEGINNKKFIKNRNLLKKYLDRYEGDIKIPDYIKDPKEAEYFKGIRRRNGAILSMYYAVGFEEAIEIQEIAEKFKCSRARIKQLINKEVRVLIAHDQLEKTKSESKDLNDYFNSEIVFDKCFCGMKARFPLKANGINTLKKITFYKEDDLLSLPNFGRAALRQTIGILGDNGLKLS